MECVNIKTNAGISLVRIKFDICDLFAAARASILLTQPMDSSIDTEQFEQTICVWMPAEVLPTQHLYRLLSNFRLVCDAQKATSSKREKVSMVCLLFYFNFQEANSPLDRHSSCSDILDSGLECSTYHRSDNG
jgi:hypothetical protein